jgi:hypothetical protein
MHKPLFNPAQAPRLVFGKRHRSFPILTAEDRKPVPTAAEAAAYVAIRAAEYGAYAVLAIAILFAWVGTPA